MKIITAREKRKELFARQDKEVEDQLQKAREAIESHNDTREEYFYVEVEGALLSGVEEILVRDEYTVHTVDSSPLDHDSFIIIWSAQAAMKWNRRWPPTKTPRQLMGLGLVPE